MLKTARDLGGDLNGVGYTFRKFVSYFRFGRSKGLPEAIGEFLVLGPEGCKIIRPPISPVFSRPSSIADSGPKRVTECILELPISDEEDLAMDIKTSAAKALFREEAAFWVFLGIRIEHEDDIAIIVVKELGEIPRSNVVLAVQQADASRCEAKPVVVPNAKETG